MKTILLSYLMLFPFIAFSQCLVLNSDRSVAPNKSDALFISLTKEKECPQNVFELKSLLVQDGFKIVPSMVANRGRHNSSFGSFSVFESVQGKSLNPGDLFFGHFTDLNSVVDFDQAKAPNKLLIELIVWDTQKEMFNFYELIGQLQAKGNIWFYRGDSKDAYLDNTLLRRQLNPNAPKFGSKMRCSACHNSGGPIMKEIDFPYNDWWTSKRPLNFNPNSISERLSSLTQDLADASSFSSWVRSGMKKLDQSQSFLNFKASLSMQENLRPLFCTTEINLISGDVSLEERADSFHVSSRFWVDPFWGDQKLKLNQSLYYQSLKKLGMQFPENGAIDADHPWLAPVKGLADRNAILNLIAQAEIDENFAAAVLALDFKNPLFSRKRCELLKLIPDQSTDWKGDFVKRLRASRLEGAQELFVNLTKNKLDHLDQIQKYLQSVQEQLEDPAGILLMLKDLQKKRSSVGQDEISKNPRGQILEPGFRVIFPEIQ